MKTIACISDTHCQMHKVVVPDADILIHAGDWLSRGDIPEFGRFIEVFKKLPHKTKILVAGNHDRIAEWNQTLVRDTCELNNIIYLQDEAVIIEGLKIYGSPHQPAFCNWAFNLPRGEALRVKWAQIPEDTDVLVTHSPPAGILDYTTRGESVGCVDLRARVSQLSNLKVHVFGHTHSGYGSIKVGDTTFINAASCDESYNPSHVPIIIGV